MNGYMGNGVQSSSSSSNLSPLAPPFTVDRSNSKQNPQYPTPTSSWHHNSLDLFPNPSDFGLESVRTTTPLASSTDFNYNSNPNNTWSNKNPNPSSGSFGNPGPYYTPYDPPLPYVSSVTGVDDNAPPIQPSYDFLTSRSLSGIPEWGGLWNGSSTDGKLMATDSINRGTTSEVDSTFTQGNYVDGFGRENQDNTFVGKNRKPVSVEISSNFLTKNDHLSSSRARSGFNVADMTVMDGFLLKVDSSDVAAVNSSDSLDSPCWKGAPASASHMSASFEVADQQQKHILTKKPEASSSSSAHNLSSREGGIHIFPPFGDPLKSQPVFGTSFQNEATFQHGKHDSNNGFSIPPEISKLPAREQCNKSTDRAPKRNSSSTKPIQPIDKNVKLKDSEKQQGVKVDLLSLQKLNLKSDAVITHEKTTGRESVPDMDVHMLVNAIENLSELLLSKCLHDGCALDKDDAEALKQITSNLFACNSSYANKKKNKIIVQIPPTKHQPRTFAQFSSHQHDMVGGSADQFIADEGGMKRDVVCGETIQKNNEQLFTALRNDDGAAISKDYHVILDIKKVLDKDFECEEELESDSGLFKNLWLEAEAELCLSNYRTRFERFRKTRETDRSNKNLGLGIAKDSELQKEKHVLEKASTLEGLGTSQVSDCPQEPASDGHVVPLVNSNRDDVESSVMARFQILKSRTINQEGKIPDDRPVMASEMTQREDNNNNKNFQVAVGPSYLKDEELGYNGYYEGYVNEKKLNVHGSSPMYEPSSPRYEPSSPSYEPISYDIWKNSVSAKIASGAAEWYNPSLDWEHVLKDDFVSTLSSQSSLQPI